MSILYCFQVIIAYFPNFQDVTLPRQLKGQFVIPMLMHYMANQCTKFEVSRFNHSGDILGGTKNLNGSCDVTTMHLSGTVCPRWSETSYDQPVYQI